MIAHLDLDCFYASVEMRERPELRHKPLAIGGAGRRGVITTCNYVARAHGVRSAMPGYLAREKCPDLVFLPVRFDLYREESRRIFGFLASECEELERSSIDEAYFRVPREPHEAWRFCEYRREIRIRFGLTASVGIAPNKMLAKIMSGFRKPDGLQMIRDEQVASFMPSLELSHIPGIGPKTLQKMQQMGLRHCGDLQAFSAEELLAYWGRWGLQLYENCRGIDRRPLCLWHERKSLSLERTFLRDITSEESLISHLRSLHGDLVDRLQSKTQASRVSKIFIRFKFSDFIRLSRESSTSELQFEHFEDLARRAYNDRPSDVRLIGLGVRFESRRERPRDPRQLGLWDK